MDFDKAIDLDPKDPVPYLNRGKAYDGLGNYKLGIDNYKIAARLGDKETQDYLKSKSISWLLILCKEWTN
jgi:regulator of sirC expression with transglutaminase-like and TPR domain